MNKLLICILLYLFVELSYQEDSTVSSQPESSSTKIDKKPEDKNDTSNDEDSTLVRNMQHAVFDPKDKDPVYEEEYFVGKPLVDEEEYLDITDKAFLRKKETADRIENDNLIEGRGFLSMGHEGDETGPGRDTFHHQSPLVQMAVDVPTNDSLESEDYDVIPLPLHLENKCISPLGAAMRRYVLREKYEAEPCPASLPCRHALSCIIWVNSHKMIMPDYTLSISNGTRYYKELFEKDEKFFPEGIDRRPMLVIQEHFVECVQHYHLEDDRSVDLKGRRLLKYCYERAKQIKECQSIIEAKGICYQTNSILTQ